MRAWLTVELYKRGIEEVNATAVTPDRIRFYRASEHFPRYCSGKGTRWHEIKENAIKKLQEFKKNKLIFEAKGQDRGQNKRQNKGPFPLTRFRE